jgi:hypothetical protein
MKNIKCEHGTLKRKCRICKLEVELAEIKRRLDIEEAIRAILLMKILLGESK